MTLEAKLGSPAAAAFIRAMTKAAYRRYRAVGLPTDEARARALKEGADWLAELLAGTFEAVNNEPVRSTHMAGTAGLRRSPAPHYQQEVLL